MHCGLTADQKWELLKRQRASLFLPSDLPRFPRREAGPWKPDRSWDLNANRRWSAQRPACHSLQTSLPDTDVRTVNLSTKRKAAKGQESGKAEQKRQVFECRGTSLPAVWPARGQEALATQ